VMSPGTFVISASRMNEAARRLNKKATAVASRDIEEIVRTFPRRMYSQHRNRRFAHVIKRDLIARSEITRMGYANVRSEFDFDQRRATSRCARMKRAVTPERRQGTKKKLAEQNLFTVARWSFDEQRTSSRRRKRNATTMEKQQREREGEIDICSKS